MLGIVTLVSGIAAQWWPRALPVGRLALGVFYVVTGALVNAVYLATGSSYAVFADAAHVSFVRTTWQSVVAPNQTFFIGLLIAFEATVGVLVLMGGRKAQLGMAGILAMQACLLLFGWLLTAFGLFMLVAVGLLLRGRCATTVPGSGIRSPGRAGWP